MKCSKFKQTTSGQAIMEFILGLMIVISTFFFFMKMSAVFVVGNYIHYATFMSARAYMSSSASMGDQQSRAESVLEKMLANRWKSMIKPESGSGGSVPGGFVGTGPYAQEDPARNGWNQGATFAYVAKLSLYPWNKDGQGVEMKLTSESWMPREQSVSECNQTRAKIEAALVQTGLNGIQVEWDENGC